MQLVELATVRHRLAVGVPLPFNVRHVDHTLLLARGQILDSQEQLEALCMRGMLVDIDEVLTPQERALQAPAHLLPQLWERSIDRVRDALQALPASGFEAVVDEVAQPLVTLIERDPDLAIFQVMRQHGSHLAQYGVNHSIHCAIAAFLTAERLAWDAPAMQLAFKASLTMNVSMLELQGQLATQATAPTPAQRQAIDSHPLRSVSMLQQSGIGDEAWLQAVAQHHEVPDGSGYPAGLTEVSPLAALLRQCDVYTAKLSPRQSREALAADVVARKLFTDSPKDPMISALIKQFGIYPPGSFVRLASGETGIVTRRGASAHTPLVAALTNDRGSSLSEPVRRDTSRPQYAIVATLGAKSAQFTVAPEQLMALLSA